MTLIMQTSFEGGVADDIRAPLHFRRKIFSTSQFSIAKHFDIFTQPYKLTPYRTLIADTNDGSTSTGMKQYFVKDFLYASASGKLYGLGQNGSGNTKIVYKADATTGNWTLPGSSEGNGAVKNGCLVEYKDALWGFQGTNQVWKWGALSSVPSITNSQGTTSTTITSVAQGVIAKDDNLYLAYNNIVMRVTAGGTVNDSVLVLPTNLKITSLTNYGNYLGVGCAPVASYNGKSKVFLWNLTSTDVQETIDWGEGDLRILETIEGMLVGVTDRYLNNSVGAGKGSMIIQTYSGGTPQVIKEIFTAALTGISIPLTKIVKNNRLFFAVKLMTNAAGTEYNEGLWSFGRKNSSYSYALSLDMIDENVTTSGIQGFGAAGNYFFIAHSADGSIDKTNSAATYTFTSIIETTLWDFSSVDTQKKLSYVKVSFPSLATGQSLTLKYRVDEATAWTTIGSFNTTGELSHTFLNNESTGAAFATAKEFQFRIESTGGLEITGLLVDGDYLTTI